MTRIFDANSSFDRPETNRLPSMKAMWVMVCTPISPAGSIWSG